MIFDRIKIENFGLYKGEYFFDIGPLPSEGKHITIISGKNGVGKSTLQEAIHLCLLGPLSVDNRVSESFYERYLLSRSYKNSATPNQKSSVELTFSFVKSGAPVKYRVLRQWNNSLNEINEEVHIWENENELKDLNKRERNFFVRELIQPGFTKVMFFDGEKLSSLFEGENFRAFVSESCKYLFGLNFIDLLQTDLNYFLNKIHGQQESTEHLDEIKKIEDQIASIQTEINRLETEGQKAQAVVAEVKDKISSKEEEISKQGRWVTKKLDKLKSDRQSLETTIKNAKKELLDLYAHLGPFVFCRELCLSLKSRLVVERDIEKWQHAKELLSAKAHEIEQFWKSTEVDSLNIDAKLRKAIVSSTKRILLANPTSFSSEEKIYHELADTDRTKLINKIEEIDRAILTKIRTHSSAISQSEESLKQINKEQVSFSKEDLVLPLIKELQELNKQLGAVELKIRSIQNRLNEEVKRKEFYSSKLQSSQGKLYQDSNINSKMQLSSKTKLVLNEYAQLLLAKKLELLQEKVLSNFNLLCRKENYFDKLTIDPTNFELNLSKDNVASAHKHLSAGEKQLLILSFLWGLRELSNVALPLVIDTPLSRLDSEHRKSFVNQFLPAIHPQVILIGTDTEIMSSVFQDLKPFIARHYHLQYNRGERSTQIENNFRKENQFAAV